MMGNLGPILLGENNKFHSLAKGEDIHNSIQMFRDNYCITDGTNTSSRNYTHYQCPKR